MREEQTPPPCDHDDAPAPAEPLPGTWDEETEAFGGSFLCPRGLCQAESEDLQRFAHACLRYAYLERRVQGEILCELPAHLTILQGSPFAGLVEEAEALAEAERACLGVPEGPIEDLAELLDDRGIKIFEWARSAGREPAGAFLMCAATGPALLALASPGSPAGRFILAHQYGHLVADVDPYENRFCPMVATDHGLAGSAASLAESDASVADDDLLLSESRADLFARSLLVPRDHFAGTLRMFGQGRQTGFDPARLVGVAFYYGVEPALILHRLVDLEWMTTQEARDLEHRLPSSSGQAHPPAGPPSSGALPHRFITLALALFLKGKVSKAQMGVLLDADEQGVDRALGWVGAPPRPQTEAPGSYEPPQG